ncbi:hypothetical protein [Spirosoma endophyticum]|uniref:Uncharacterized protein n=1 Tax=Spirosoma endophyticum TaxID=662367 RepID=A0A1I1IGW0_9BACT|nr:hypothetical protein [Spirosoma endophyticum]SFC35549.1 hypothetical protein SAMN05216167_101942 [Spirosoma endophyticum]
MKRLLCLLVLTNVGYAQVPAQSIRRDSVPEVFPLRVDSPDPMPNRRPNNSFYRYQAGRSTVMRATLDNMAVKIPDSSTHYTMLRSFRKYGKPEEPPTQFLRPMKPVLPKKYK